MRVDDGSAAIAQARHHAAEISRRLQLADRSLRAAAGDLRAASGDLRAASGDLRRSATERAGAGTTGAGVAPRYFEALAHADAGGRLAPIHGVIASVPALSKLNLEDLAKGDSVILTLPRPAQRPRVMMVRATGAPDKSPKLLLAGIDPAFLWEVDTSDASGVERCIRDDAGRVLYCSGARLEPILGKLARPAGAEPVWSMVWRFEDTLRTVGFARLDLPLSSFSGIWTVIAADPRPANAGLADRLPVSLTALLAALASGVLAACIAWRASAARRLDPAGAMPSPSTGLGDGDKDSLARQRRTIGAMAEIDRAILSGADADRLPGLAARLTLECVGCKGVMLALQDREAPGRLTVWISAADRKEPLLRDADTLSPATVALLDAHPEGFWTERLADLQFLAPLQQFGAAAALLLPVHEDGRRAGWMALGVADRTALGNDALAHARALAVRLGVALTSANRARALYSHTHFDATTGLPNRRYLREHLGPQIARTRRDEQRLAMLFIDLDGFKQVNAAAGHDQGDLILAETASRLKSCLREEDVLARFGGDEFVVVLPRIAEGLDARKVADKLLATLAQTYLAAGEEFQLGASIGISLFPDDAQSVDELLRHADFAMFRAKAAGRGQYAFFNDAVNRKATARARLEGELRRATENREFVVYYQPQIDLKLGRVVGAEALVRWRHPQRGMVAPGEFIGVAEQSNLILQIGEQVLRESCAQFRQWESTGIAPPHISVNVTGLELKRADFADRIEAILAEFGLRPYCLELEITESSLLENSTLILAQLAQLRQRGIRIALDDFGTGYSSLAYLKRLPVDVVKIDQSFVRDIGSDADSASITRAIVDMVHSLGKVTVAEGIETEAQRAHLTALGCEAGQGYLWSRPVPAAEFEALCRAWRAPQPRAVTPLAVAA